MLQAHELAQVNLPEQYLPLNISAARFNIEKAAYLGFPKAQTKMGAAYELCQLGCDFDPLLSLHYNALAAKQGESEAEMAISKWFLCGYEGAFEKNEELAFNYAQRAADNGLPTAEFALGYFYEIGIYVPSDLKLSRLWYEKAAEHGNKDAAGRIDGISRSKTLSRKDHEDVAVAKIKSQYGSHRGKRPDRFKTSAAPMPTITDDPIDMPEPRIPQAQSGQQMYEYRNPNAPVVRPVSAAPYPVDDRMGRPVMSSQAYANPHLSTGPDTRPPSAAPSETSFGDNNFRGSGYPTFQHSRPVTAGSELGVGRGRGTPSAGAENTGTFRGRGGPTFGSQDHAQPGPGHASPRPPGSPTINASRPLTTPSQSPAIDIGFSAPPDLSGADRKFRQQRIDNKNMPPPSPLPRYPSQDDAALRNNQRIASAPPPPHSSTMPISNRIDGSQLRPVSSGRPGVTLQDRPHRATTSVTLSDVAPKIPDVDLPAATPPPSVPMARPPGKGPKTFQEMGVEPTKSDGDCVSPPRGSSLISDDADYSIGYDVVL